MIRTASHLGYSIGIDALECFNDEQHDHDIVLESITISSGKKSEKDTAINLICIMTISFRLARVELL